MHFETIYCFGCALALRDYADEDGSLIWKKKRERLYYYTALLYPLTDSVLP